MSYANSLSGNMASAARLVLATSLAASSTVRPWSWLMTDMTMFIITWSRRSLRRSSSCSCCSLLAGCGLPWSSRSDSPIEFPSRKARSALNPLAASGVLAARLQLDVPRHPAVAHEGCGRHHTPKRWFCSQLIKHFANGDQHPGPPPSPVLGLGGVVSCHLHRIHPEEPWQRQQRNTRNW